MHERLITQVSALARNCAPAATTMTRPAGAPLDQQNVASGDLQAGTRAIAYLPGSHRWSAELAANQKDTTTQRTQYNANGQPLQASGPRSYRWDALGRLEQVSEQGAPLAAYRYSHRGERIAKHAGKAQGGSRAYLYESGQLSAELDAQGRITRQYIHLGQLPLAVIDTPQGRKPADGAGTLGRIVQDLGTIAGRWLGGGGGERLAWLHTSHLGAVEAATDTQGQLIWRAHYTAFGRQQVLSKASDPVLKCRCACRASTTMLKPGCTTTCTATTTRTGANTSHPIRWACRMDPIPTAMCGAIRCGMWIRRG